MGNSTSTNTVIADNPNRKVFVQFLKMGASEVGLFGTYVFFTFVLRYRRFKWEVTLRYSDLLQIQKKLQRLYPQDMLLIPHLTRRNKLFWAQDKTFLEERAAGMAKYLQDILDMEKMVAIPVVRIMLACSEVSFNPDFGRKGKEGWLCKSSGGYNEKFSRKAGDFIQIWKWRWIVVTDSCLLWYKNPTERVPQGSLQMDQDFLVLQAGRVLSIRTATRRFAFQAATTRLALEWATELQKFYRGRARITPQPHQASAPPRPHNDVKVYTTSKEYFQSLAIALLSAQKEILITSWKNSPGVLLTRPPLPPLRLDQLLQMKAEQGVMIYVLLYKEVEHIGQGNDSLNTKKRLETLSSNIRVIRHPNKFIGGATAVLWSHHEKLVIIDRNIAFVGGIDLSYQRYDDESHAVADEDGVRFPGNDYRQPAPDAFKPARKIDFDTEANDSDEEMIEVEIATATDARLPMALTSVMDSDDQPYVEDVVVDFGITQAVVATAPPAGSRHRTASRTMSTASAASPSAPPSAAPLASALTTSAVQSLAIQSPNQQARDEDALSDASSNLEEDMHAPMTTEEQEALDKYERNSEAGSIMSERASSVSAKGGRELVRSMRTSLYSVSTGVSSSLNSVSDVVTSFTSQAQSVITSYVGQTYNTKKLKTSHYWGARDLYPRMPWHDVQAVVSGPAARDVATHFIQRWNHHRLSVADYSQPILYDITDDLYSSACARCEETQLFETLTVCPKCGHDLGPSNSFSLPLANTLLPSPPDDAFTFLVYSYTLPVSCKLPFRLQGDCPVVVASLIGAGTSDVASEWSGKDGTLLDIRGPLAEEWSMKGDCSSMYPAIGDVILSVNDLAVSHLNSNQIKRLVKRVRKGVAVSTLCTDVYTITFRRHYHPDLPTPGEMEALTSTVVLSVQEVGLPVVIATALEVNAVEVIKQPSAPNDPSNPPSPHPPRSPEPSSASANAMPYTPVSISSPSPSTPNRSGKMTSSPTPSSSSAAATYHSICQTSAHQEISLSMSLLFHECSRTWDLPARISSIATQQAAGQLGTCTVQLLRSVGKWSIGTANETSILQAYLETITNAQHFVYIENQFFIGNLVPENVVQNSIASALVERILKAHQSGQRFRVIVIIPLHPNGDFSSAMKSQHVMHFEYATINRSPNSMFQQLQTRAPGINLDQYIGFFSLRNYGVINNKLVSDQVYVHDKLLIADDRVMIIGSANINDRSMLGCRDSEVAIKIEDTFVVDSVLNGQRCEVGYLPHSVRLKLMKQHLGDEQLDLFDIVNPTIYKQWVDHSMTNSFAYHELDGPLSLYSCNSAADYKRELAQSNPRSVLDPAVQEILQRIKGHLVDWPRNLFQKDNLAPTAATRVLVSNDLWV